MPSQLAELVSAEVARQLRERSPVRPRWLTPREAGAYVRLSWRTLERLRREGRGPRFCIVGRKKVAYDVRDLDRWVVARRSGR